jgi:hypothetical protein
MRYLYYLEIKFKWIFGDFMFRACGVNPTLQLTRGHYTRNMAVWYIRTMAASGVALLLFLLGYSPSHSPAPAVVETPVAAPWQLGWWASEPAREAVETDKHTKKTDYVVHDLRREIAEIAGWNGAPGERNSRRMKHQGKKANVTPRRKWSVWCNAASGVIEVPEVDREGWAE